MALRHLATKLTALHLETGDADAAVPALRTNRITRYPRQGSRSEGRLFTLPGDVAFPIEGDKSSRLG